MVLTVVNMTEEEACLKVFWASKMILDWFKVLKSSF